MRSRRLIYRAIARLVEEGTRGHDARCDAAAGAVLPGADRLPGHRRGGARCRAPIGSAVLALPPGLVVRVAGGVGPMLLAVGAAIPAALERALETAGRAVLCVALGFTVFAPSPSRAFRLTGLLTPASMLASYLAALTVMPPALLTARPAFLCGRRAPLLP